MSSAFNQPFPSSCFGICNPEGPFHHSASSSFPTARRADYDVEGSLTFQDEQRKQEVDDLLSQAMNGLTFQERQEQQEILHGVVDQFVEDEAFMDRVLQDLEHHLFNMKQGSVYEMAERMDPEYVSARPFRVMFLRGNRYNAERAANQMMRFFESKLELFGRDKLVQDITIADLNEDDIACLKVGALQTAGRDRSGRQVFVFYARLFGELITSSSMTLQNYLRAQYFVAMTGLQSEETQLRGTISIWYAVGDWKDTSNASQGYLERMSAAAVFPQKKQAIHLCMDDFRQYAVGSIITKLVPKKGLRNRLRFHFGSQTECQYKMLTYGILSGTLALDADGRMNLNRHLGWVHNAYVNNTEDTSTLHHADAASNSSSMPSIIIASSAVTTVSSPKPNDVLFTGGKVNYQGGNQYLLALVDDYARAYTEPEKIK